MNILTPDELSRALSLALDLPADEAAAHAERVLDLFGFDERVVDNVLQPDERQLLYALQDSGLFTTRSEETDLWNGQVWRTHYWVMRSDRIAALAEPAAGESPDDAARAGEEVYAVLPPSAWARR